MAAAAGVFAVAPQVASAQILDPESSGREYCASSGPDASRYTSPDPWNDLTLGVEPAGAGVVEARMYAMSSDQDCIRPKGTTDSTGLDRCDAAQCRFEVQTVCELHCGVHRHSTPFPWTVRLSAAPAAGSSAPYFHGWRAPCSPRKGVDWRDCIVSMDVDRTATAVFRAQPDGTPPSPAPTARVTPLGGYNLDVAWSASGGEFLAGYDILVDGAVKSRVPASSTTARLTVTCSTSYAVQVVAYDFAGNPAGSNVVNVRSGACNVGAAPRPNTVIHVKPRRTTRSRTAFFHFGIRGDVRATKYQCKLDKRRWTRCSGSTGKRYRKLRKGYHTFRVRAGNSAGFDRTPAKWRWRVR